jgi:hypothetical protein
MSSDEIEYYRARAEQERKAADDASQADVAAIHLELAKAYEALVREPALRLRAGPPETGVRLRHTLAPSHWPEPGTSRPTLPSCDNRR